VPNYYLNHFHTFCIHLANRISNDLVQSGPIKWRLLYMDYGISFLCLKLKNDILKYLQKWFNLKFWHFCKFLCKFSKYSESCYCFVICYYAIFKNLFNIQSNLYCMHTCLLADKKRKYDGWRAVSVSTTTSCRCHDTKGTSCYAICGKFS
jgi:hypothetical protein